MYSLSFGGRSIRTTGLGFLCLEEYDGEYSKTASADSLRAGDR